MIRDILSLRGAKILHFDTGECLALLNWPIIDPDTGVIEAFWVKPLTIVQSDAILLTSDILQFKKNLYVKSDKVFCNPVEVIRIAAILDQKREFLFAPVQSEKGRRHGRVYNLSFSTETYVLRQLYTGRKLFGLIPFMTKIFPYERVLKVLPSYIVIEDNSTKTEEVVPDSAEPA